MVASIPFVRARQVKAEVIRPTYYGGEVAVQAEALKPGQAFKTVVAPRPRIRVTPTPATITTTVTIPAQQQKPLQVTTPAQRPSLFTRIGEKLGLRQFVRPRAKLTFETLTISPALQPSPFEARPPSPGFFGWFRLRKAPSPKPSFKSYPVQVRRFGKWIKVGEALTPMRAIQIGRGVVGRTLAASFRIPAVGKIPTKVPGFKTKKTKEGVIFIEPKERRLKRFSFEIPEIQYYRALKGGIARR